MKNYFLSMDFFIDMPNQKINKTSVVHRFLRKSEDRIKYINEKENLRLILTSVKPAIILLEENYKTVTNEIGIFYVISLL